MTWVFGRLPFAYGGDGTLKEHGNECYDVVDLSPVRNLLPLNSIGSDGEEGEDTYTTGSTRIVIVNWRNRVLTVHHAIEERPNGERSRIADLGPTCRKARNVEEVGKGSEREGMRVRN